MTDYRELCAELVERAPDARRMDGIQSWEALLDRARAALAVAEPGDAQMIELTNRATLAEPAWDVRYEFSVVDGDHVEQAGGSAPTFEQALSEGRRYLAQYQQDGSHTLEIRRVEILISDAMSLPGGEART